MQFKPFDIHVSNDTKFCEKTCPQLKDGLCTVFSHTLEERNIAKYIAPKILRSDACKTGEKYAHQIIDPLIGRIRDDEF